MPFKAVDGEERGTGVKDRISTRDTCTFARPDYRVGMLNLTRQEQAVMIFILVALLMGAGIRHLRLNAMLPERTATYSGSTH